MTLSAANTLAALRRDIASLEAARPVSRTRHHRLDREPAMFCAAGGPLRGALHEIAAARESEIAAATGFALALAARATSRAVLWTGEDMACAESGALHGPGLDLFGLAPERFLAVQAAHPRDVLWTMEEALRCAAVGAVIGEFRRSGLGLTATRRLSLAAASNHGIALLLRTTPDVEPSAAATRWVIGAAPSAPHAASHAPGSPRIEAQLVRNRFGEPGTWTLEWNDDERNFARAPADREPVVQAAFDRPRRAAAGP
ncbi:MAG TPA: DNA repair protein [Pseudolabrys sp.]|nr:DNA repair protein [Pseudolabrys sp.]